MAILDNIDSGLGLPGNIEFAKCPRYRPGGTLSTGYVVVILCACSSLPRTHIC